MKKILMGATALSMLGFAGAASAQEWSADIGGFMTAGIGYVDADFHTSEVEIVNNGEVVFNFKLVADNGITFGAKVEFEASGTSENADEYVATIGGSFGSIEIGREDGAGDRLLGAAAGNTAFTAAADETGLLFDYAADATPFLVVTDGADTGDALKITYFTPSFSGFKAGVSYTPGQTGNGGNSTFGGGIAGGAQIDADDDNEGFELGAQYKNDFGAVALELGANYIDFQDDGFAFDNSYAFVLNVGFGGFKIGGIYGQAEANSGNEDRTGYGIGANYATGPWNFGIQAAFGEDAQEDNFGLSGGVDYALAPGVTVGAIAEYADGDEVVAVNTGNGSGDSAFAIGVFTNFDF